MGKTKSKKLKAVTLVLDPAKPKVGKLVGEFWEWPSGKKTNLTHIRLGVQQYKHLPRGFYAAVEKSNLRNLKLLMIKAKGLGLKDDRDE